MSTKLLTDKDLSTDITSDAASDIKVVTPKAVVDYVGEQIGIAVDKTGGAGFTKIGINNSTPSVALDVYGDATLGKNATYSDGIMNTNGSAGQVNLGDWTGVNNVTFIQITDSIQKIELRAASGLVFTSYGSLSIVGSPTANLQVDASGNVIEGTGFTGDVVAGQTMTFENGILKTVV